MASTFVQRLRCILRPSYPPIFRGTFAQLSTYPRSPARTFSLVALNRGRKESSSLDGHDEQDGFEGEVDAGLSSKAPSVQEYSGDVNDMPKDRAPGNVQDGTNYDSEAYFGFTPPPSPKIKGTVTPVLGKKTTFLPFSAIEGSVREEMFRSAGEAKIHLKTLPHFSSTLLAGLRFGELTIFTGPTGCGKV